MFHLVAGGAGFIGSNLVRRLLARGDRVLVLDDFSLGRHDLLEPTSGLTVLAVDCADAEAVARACAGHPPVDRLWHLAANSDIPSGVRDVRVDLDRTFLTTIGLMAALKERPAPLVHFASSSAVYGDIGDEPAAETTGPLLPISNYGAMKLASEAALSAAAEAQGTRLAIHRFPNVVGVPATHGVILDFIRKLTADPRRLDVLGDGRQRKPYLHVDELVDAMLVIDANASDKRTVLNIGPEDEGITVTRIAELVRDVIAPDASILYGTEPRGWVGDVPRFRYSTERLSALGFRPQLSSEQAVTRAIREIAAQEGAPCRL